MLEAPSDLQCVDSKSTGKALRRSDSRHTHTRAHVVVPRKNGPRGAIWQIVSVTESRNSTRNQDGRDGTKHEASQIMAVLATFDKFPKTTHSHAYGLLVTATSDSQPVAGAATAEAAIRNHVRQSPPSVPVEIHLRIFGKTPFSL